MVKGSETCVGVWKSTANKIVLAEIFAANIFAADFALSPQDLGLSPQDLRIGQHAPCHSCNDGGVHS